MTRVERRVIAARIRRRLHQVFAEFEDYPPLWRQQMYRLIRRNEGKDFPPGMLGIYRRYYDREYHIAGRRAKHLREIARLNEELRLWQRGELDDAIF